jgi:hypothetical protein
VCTTRERFPNVRVYSSTLTPVHLRKAKLIFFFTRYPSSTILKTCFPDIRFNKNNTAQLVKWFSNFRYVLLEQFGAHTAACASPMTVWAGDIRNHIATRAREDVSTG